MSSCTEASQRATTFLAIGLWCGLLLFYSKVYTFDSLNFDDDLYVFQNPAVRDGLSWQGVHWAFTSAHGGHWHPLSWLSHMADCSLIGMSPGMHHLVNVVIHASSSVLLFFFILRLNFTTPIVSFFASLFFAIHPMRLESVVWIAERKDVLSMFFMTFSLNAYLTYQRGRSRGWYLVTFFGTCMALLSKPSSVVLPLLFLLLDWWPLPRKDIRWNSLLKEKLPFIMAALGCSVAAILSQGAGGGLKSFSLFPVDSRVATTMVGYTVYLGKFFLPTGQGIFYPYQLYQPGVASAATLLIIIVTIICIAQRKSNPSLLFGWVWFLVSIIPISGIVQIGGQSYADRWSYLPHVGLIIGLLPLWPSLAKRLPGVTIAFPAMVLVVGVATFCQLPYWRSSESIFRHTIAVAPENFMAEMNLGVALDAAGKQDEAIIHFERAVLLRPFYFDALYNLALAKMKHGDFKEAESFFRRAISENPQSYQARMHLLEVLMTRGQPGAALEECVSMMYFFDGNLKVLRFVEHLTSLSCNKFERHWHPTERLKNALNRWSSPSQADLRLSLQNVIDCRTRVHYQGREKL
jgi:protein O-mannosyl-transferase